MVVLGRGLKDKAAEKGEGGTAWNCFVSWACLAQTSGQREHRAQSSEHRAQLRGRRAGLDGNDNIEVLLACS